MHFVSCRFKNWVKKEREKGAIWKSSLHQTDFHKLLQCFSFLAHWGKKQQHNYIFTELTSLLCPGVLKMTMITQKPSEHIVWKETIAQHLQDELKHERKPNIIWYYKINAKITLCYNKCVMYKNQQKEAKMNIINIVYTSFEVLLIKVSSYEG